MKVLSIYHYLFVLYFEIRKLRTKFCQRHLEKKSELQTMFFDSHTPFSDTQFCLSYKLLSPSVGVDGSDLVGLFLCVVFCELTGYVNLGDAS